MFIYDFTFPYKNFKFPGQYTEEKVLYATRQAPVLFRAKILAAILGLLFFDLVIFFIFNTIKFLSLNILVIGATLLLNLIALPIVFYWVKKTYEKTVLIVTNKRLTQFVQTSPFTRYQLSLAFDQVVDTAASTHTYLQSILKIGNLFARSSAGAEGDFLVQHIKVHEDLHNWLNKLLTQYTQSPEKETSLDDFRPFIPNLKGKSREEFLKDKEW